MPDGNGNGRRAIASVRSVMEQFKPAALFALPSLEDLGFS